MKKFGFFILGYKGYKCLQTFVDKFGSEYVSFVVSDRDANIEQDYYESIQLLCEANHIKFSNRRGYVDGVDLFRFAIGWRWIIPNQDNLIVFHDALLPRYRGFAPLVNALINGEKRIGVSALLAESQYDCGDILGQKSIAIKYPKKIMDAIEDVSLLYVDVLLEVAQKLIVGTNLNAVKQDDLKSSYSPWRDELDYAMNWRQSAGYLSRFVDAVGYPYKGAVTTMKGRLIRVIEAQVMPDVNVEDRSAHVGKVLFMDEGRPTVICGEGLLQLKEVADESGDSLVGKIPFRTRFGG